MKAYFLSQLWLLVLFGTGSSAKPKPVLTVYAFLSTECPISQQYVWRLADLYRQFDAQHIRFIALFPLRTDVLAVIQQFRQDYNLPFAGQPDAGARLARHFRVRVTPEVVVMKPDGRVVYQGAIDDWYVALGKHRPESTHAYLRDAIHAFLAGRAVSLPRTEAVGCLIE